METYHQNHHHGECFCNKEGKTVEGYLNGKPSNHFIKIESGAEDQEFSILIQVLLSVPILKTEIDIHDCEIRNCVACEIRRFFESMKKFEAMINITEFYQAIKELFPVNKRTSDKMLYFTLDCLNKNNGSAKRNAKLETRCSCGAFRGKDIILNNVLSPFPARTLFEPLPHYYREFINFRSILCKMSTSILLTKQEKLLDSYISHQVIPI